MVKSTSVGSRYRYAGSWSYRFVTTLKITITIISVLFFATTSFAQLAPVNPPSGGFAIDGGLRANTPTSQNQLKQIGIPVEQDGQVCNYIEASLLK